MLHDEAGCEFVKHLTKAVDCQNLNSLIRDLFI